MEYNYDKQMESFENLANAIVFQAVQDYRDFEIFKETHRTFCQDYEELLKNRRDAEHFFKTKWYMELTDLAADALIRNANETIPDMIENEKDKIRRAQERVDAYMSDRMAEYLEENKEELTPTWKRLIKRYVEANGMFDKQTAFGVFVNQLAEARANYARDREIAKVEVLDTFLKVCEEELPHDITAVFKLFLKDYRAKMNQSVNRPSGEREGKRNR